MSGENRQELPPGWATAAIEDFFAPLEDGRTLHQGWSPQCEKRPSESEDDWGVLKTTAIQAGAYLPEHNKRLPAELLPRPLIEVKAGDLLVTCAGPRVRCGVTCLVRNTRSRLMMSGKMYRFRVPEEHIDPRFVEAYLQTASARDAIDRMKTGGSDSGLNLTHDRFRQLVVPIASVNEQRRIVESYEELVSDLDAGVGALERVREKVKLYRASVLKAAVEGTLTAEWRSKQPQTEPASELLKCILIERRRRWEDEQLRKFKKKGQEPPQNWKTKYKEPVVPDTAKLPSLPLGWCWATVDQVCTEIRNGYSRKPDANEGTPILRISAVRPLVLDLDDVRYLSGSVEQYAEFFVQDGDILFTRYNGTRSFVAVCAAVPEVSVNLVHPDKLIRGRVLAPVVSAHFVALAANVGVSRRFLEERIRTTAGQAGVSGGDIKETPIPLPPLQEQSTIVEAVEDQLSVIDHLENDLGAKLKNAGALRQSILRHAFTGQLVPQDPNDEPASELLKRIAAEREACVRQAAAAKQANKNHNGPRADRRGRPKPNRTKDH